MTTTIPRAFYLPESLRSTEPTTPAGTDLAVWTYEVNGVPYAVAFAGKSNKPVVNHRFRSAEHRASCIAEHAERRRSVAARKAERSATRKAERAALAASLKVGSILSSSWGYDQTNVDFYEVVEIHGKLGLTIREIAAQVVESKGSQDLVAPVPGRYVGDPMRKIANDYGVKISSFAHARPWDGKPEYQTASGYGH